MADKTPTAHATRDLVERLEQLAVKSALNSGERQACLQAAETLLATADVRVRLDAAEAFLNDEARRLETALAALYRRQPRRLPLIEEADLVEHVRRLRALLDQAWPSEPRSVAFGAGAG